MDNPTNGGNDKRNWREKLGIGTAGNPVAPKSVEDGGVVAKPVASPVTPTPGAAKIVPRAPQPISRPAPMAPRPAAKPIVQPASASPAAPRPVAPAPVAPAPARPTVQAAISPAAPMRPAPQPAMATPNSVSPEGLANRLKAQREAAEKLAEQRIQMARQRAEAARQDAAPAPAGSQPQRPKFSFVEDDARQQAPKLAPVAPSPVLPPMVRTAPPRPVLGGEPRPLPPPRPSDYQPPAPPAYAPRTQGYQPQYRPIDPVTGYAPPAGGNRSYVPPLSQPRPTQAPRDDVDDDFGYAPPPRPVRPVRPGQPIAARPVPQSYADGDDIFEQPVRASRRPTANEYAQAYQDTAPGFEEYQERSSGPWWLIVGALVALAAAAAGYWFYSSTAGSTAANQPASNTPVVEAPAQPPKVEPEQAAVAVQPAQQQPAAQKPVVAKPTKKQIYDRIVGEQEVMGDAQITPTEEPPVQPEAGTQAVVPAGQVVPDATGPPAAVDQGAGDTAPLPVPPPPGDTGQQGQLETPQTPTAQNTAISPAASESEAALLPADGLKSGQDVAVDDVVPTPEDKLAAIKGNAAAPKIDQVPEVPGTPAAAPQVVAAPAQSPEVPDATSKDQASLASVAEQAATAPAEPQTEAAPSSTITETQQEQVAPPTAPEPVKPKAVAKPKVEKKVATAKQPTSLGARPVVLVAPKGGTAGTGTADDGIYGNLPAESQQAAADQPVAAQPKRRTILDLFNQRNAQAGSLGQSTAVQPNQQSTTVATATPQVQPQVQPQPIAPARQQQASTGSGGYVAQLASFRSRGEADQEFSRIRSKHGALISNLAPVVSETSIGGSTRYRLGLGPLGSRAAASQVCSRLISAGERDCVVTRQ